MAGFARSGNAWRTGESISRGGAGMALFAKRGQWYIDYYVEGRRVR
jgi:hypothetical protein